MEKLCEERNKNAELQKQVDELTEKREVGREELKNEIANKIFMSASHGAIQCKKMSVAIAEIEAERYVDFAWEMVQQAVKNTAKEIYDYIRSIEERGLPATCVGEWVKNRLKERYGVEVE